MYVTGREIIPTQGRLQDAMAFVGPNEILACCSVPKSHLELEFDYQLAPAEPADRDVVNR